jgi:hypothetical protein
VLGEHTEEVLRGLGYDDGQIAAMLEAGAAAGPAAESHGSFLA